MSKVKKQKMSSESNDSDSDSSVKPVLKKISKQRDEKTPEINDQYNVKNIKDSAFIKKKPGRPRKNPIKEPQPRKGISPRPEVKENYMEFLYDKPALFKKLWKSYKDLSVENMQIIFDKTQIIMWCIDHYGKNKMATRIDANKINHYYCQEKLDIGVRCKDLSLIMSTINKHYSNILFLSKKNYVKKHVKVIFHNQLEIDENHTVEIVGTYPKIYDEEKNFDTTDYPIQFELPCKYFRKMLSDIRNFSDQITIRQDSNTDPLVFEYITKDKKIKSENVVKNDSKIKFTSNVKDGDTFSMSFKIDYVKPIAISLLSDTVKIYAHETKPLIFVMTMDDGVVESKILTEIIGSKETIIMS